MCLKSINAESQEGMFGQCRRIAERTTNRHPDNIITQIMIRTQCKHPIYKKTRCSNSIFRKAAAGLPDFSGTTIPFELPDKYKDSWQAHLQRIRPFLVYGRNVWWSATEEAYVFKDGHSNPEFQSHLFHFRETDLSQVHDQQHECWETIVQNGIELPATSIKIYSQDGEYTATHEFTDHLDAAHREEHITCSDHTTSSGSNNPALNIENKQTEQPTHETEAGSLKTNSTMKI